MTYTVIVYDTGKNVIKKYSFIKRVAYETMGRVLLWKEDINSSIPDIVICYGTGMVILEKDGI